MQVVGGLGWWVVVNDDGQQVDVDASGGYVSCDQDLDLSGLDGLECALALGLGAVAVQWHCGNAALFELAGQTVRAVLGAGEDDRALVLVDDVSGE